MHSCLEEICAKVCFFSIFVAHEIFETLLSKETLLDTTILIIYIFFIEIGLSNW